jgi:hypothetical protein
VNSSISLLISGPATIQRLNATGSSVKPIAPPSPFTIALFCSWAWSMAMLENLLSNFLTVKFPLSNSAYISGCFLEKKQKHHEETHAAEKNFYAKVNRLLVTISEMGKNR